MSDMPAPSRTASRRAARLITVLVACGLLGLTAASAATFGATANLPVVLSRQVAAANRTHGAPHVLLPAHMPLDARHLYPSGTATAHGYDFALGAVRNCREATVCFVAAFSAQRGGTVSGRRVSVRGASRAGFFPLSCGASCSPPSIEYLVHGVLYTIQANMTESRHDQATLIAAAAASIAAGPRVRAPLP